ncbi:MAG: TIGR03986 family CRISPR-associated RAMP protein [Saprospiraceae bacterium]|nr:TIGR03986 family CRISPR-associated RAMP protein [Saprospiraceae bacterium]
MGKHFKKYQNSGNFKNQNGRPPQSEPTPIFQGDFKSPYNFVPYYEDNSIFRPKWSNLTFHDIPFDNGESGEIKITIQAEGDIFVRNGYAENDKLNADEYCKKLFYKPNLGKIKDVEIENQSLESKNAHETVENEDSIKRYLQFSNHKGKYFIPGTSLKGAIRNTFEIISGSKINVSKTILESNFGLRDMANNNNYRKVVNKSWPGWLYQNEGKWYISKASKLSEDTLVGKITSQEVADEFSLDSNFYNDKEMTIEEKLKLIGDNVLKQHKFTEDIVDSVTYCSFTDEAELEGYLVVYGNIETKKHEFIFGEPEEIRYDVPESLMSNHSEIYNTIGSNNWDIITKHYSKLGKIPLFFTYEKKTVTSFGITKLYRLNNTIKVKEFCPNYRADQDLTETLFGTTESKGRVFFSHFWSEKDAEYSLRDMKIEKRVLSSPKPSYYPTYLTQDTQKINSGSYHTYATDPNKNHVSIRGFKKYPIHLTTKPETIYNQNTDKNNDKIFTFFSPISNPLFTGSIRFHNLRPEEIGALISALTHHDNDHFYHNLGSAKPYGFGKIKILINDKEKWLKYLKYFEECLLENKINTEEQTKELFSMSELPSNKTDKLLEYPKLELPNKPKKYQNEFNNYKREFQYLRPYSEYFLAKKDEKK